MTFEEVVDQALGMLQRRGRVTYRMLQRHFQLDDAALEDLSLSPGTPTSFHIAPSFSTRLSPML